LFLENLNKQKIFDSIYPQVSGIEKVYRKMDLLLTPHVIAVRTVREALASGLPIVAATGSRYADFRANPNDLYGYANEIGRAWEFISKDELPFRVGARQTAEKEFNLNMVGNRVKTLLTEVLK
jgi:glycosyltransferase involved in cell wall biosynthesis